MRPRSDILELECLGCLGADLAAGIGIDLEVDAIGRDQAPQRRQPTILGQLVGKAGLEDFGRDAGPTGEPGDKVGSAVGEGGVGRDVEAGGGDAKAFGEGVGSVGVRRDVRVTT